MTAPLGYYGQDEGCLCASLRLSTNFCQQRQTSFFDVIYLPLLVFTFLSMLTVDVLTKCLKGLCRKALTCQQSCQRASQICQHVHQNGQSGSFLTTVKPICSYLSTGLLTNALTAEAGSAASETGIRSHPRCVPYLS